MSRHRLRRRRPTRTTLAMALAWALLLAGIIAGFYFGDQHTCLLLPQGAGGGTTCG